MTINLTIDELDEVRRILHKALVIGASCRSPKVWIFGSRATGRARPFSDLDLLISLPEKLDWRVRSDLADAFEASKLPFRVDVVDAVNLSPGFAARVWAECQQVEF